MASVNVGFAPAVSPVVVTGGVTAAPEGEGGEPGLFAALLALLGPQPAAEGETAVPAPASPTPLLDIIGVPNAAAQTEQGKSLLKDLGDALIAINDALAAGKPIDPALAKKLSDSLDAVAVYLGSMAPPAPPIDPKISALASGDGIIPEIAPTLPEVPAEPALPTSTPALPDAAPEAEAFVPATTPILDAAPDVAPAASNAPVVTERLVALGSDGAKLPLSIVAAGTPSITLKAEETEPETVAVGTPVVAAPEPGREEATTVAPAPAKQATAEGAAEQQAVPPALAKLAKLVESLGKALEDQSPELATKLQALAKSLEAGKVPADLLAALSGDAAADPEIARIVEALSAPRPAAAKAPTPQPFTAPALDLPAAVAQSKPAAAPEPAPAATPPQPADALDPPDVADGTARPVLTAHVVPDARPVEHEAKPAQAAATVPAPAADNTAATPPASTPPPAAVPAARTIHAAYQTPVQQVNLPQVAFEVVRQFEAGNSRFQIRLDPPELGRIDVKLDVDKSGTINARMTVERPETLDLMQRDQRALQQALQQAGLDASKTNLEFSLRQNPFAQQGGTGDGRGGQPGFAGQGGGLAGGDETAAELATTTYRGTASAGGLNLFV